MSGGVFSVGVTVSFLYESKYDGYFYLSEGDMICVVGYEKHYLNGCMKGGVFH